MLEPHIQICYYGNHEIFYTTMWEIYYVNKLLQYVA